MSSEPQISLSVVNAPTADSTVPASPQFNLTDSNSPQATLSLVSAPTANLVVPATPSFTLAGLFGGTDVLITGSRGLHVADFYGLDGVQVFTSGTKVFVSGNFSGTVGVRDLNGLGGSVLLEGHEGITLGQSGQTILISGNTGVAQNQLDALSGWASYTIQSTGQQSFLYSTDIGTLISGNLAQTGADLIARDFAISGGLESRIAQSGAASIAYALLASGTLESHIADSGQSGVIFVSGISGALQSQIDALPTFHNLEQTGQQAVQFAVGVGTSLSGNLFNTGSFLYNLLTGNSGQGVADYATKTQLYNSGVILYNLIVGESGALLSTISDTGNQAWNAADNNGINLSGALTQTGINLYRLITGGSGQASNDYATKGILYQSGNALYTLLTGESGALISTIGYTGQQNYTDLTNNALNLSGNLAQTGAMILGQILLVSGGLEVRIAQTGDAAIDYANILNASTLSLLGQSGQTLLGLISNLYLGTPNSSWQIETGASGILLKNTPSGLVLRNYNDTIGGDLVVRNLTVQGTQTIANSTNLSVANQYIYLNQSGVPQDGGIELLRSGDTAASLLWNESAGRWAAGLSGSESLIVLSSDTGNFAIKALVQATGAANYSTLLSLSGFDAAQLAQTGSDLFAYTLSSSGVLESVIFATGKAAVSHANGIGVNLSGALTQTGNIIENQINSLSGFVIAASGGLETRLFQTGAAVITFANGAASIISGNLTQTGITLLAQNASLSGFVTGISGYLQSEIGSISAGVVSVNGQSGTLTFRGTGGQTVISGGPTLILISGDQSISGALTSTGVALGQTISSVSGGLEARITASGNATISHANGIGINLSGNLTSTGIALLGVIANTGQQAWVAANNNGLNLSGNLAASGAALILRESGISGVLQGEINGLTGYVNSLNNRSGVLSITGTGIITVITNSNTIIVSGDTSISGVLTATGAALGSTINAISGGLEARIASSGNAGIVYANGIGSNLSGNLGLTGLNLYTLLSNESGQNRVNYAPATANYTYLTGNQTITGSTTFVGNISTLSGSYDLQSLTVSSNYSLLGTESRIYCNNTTPITLTFPSAVTFSGYLGKIKLINTGSVYFTGTAGQTFDGSPFYSTVGSYQVREVHSNGVNWWVW